MTLPHLLLTVLLVAFPTGAVAALGSRGALGRALVAGCGLTGALAGLGLGVVCLGTGLVPTFSAAFLPLTGFAVRVDGLSAFFLVVIGVVGAAARYTASVTRPRTRGAIPCGCSARCSTCCCSP